MESFLFETIKKNVSTDNPIYNILNSNDPISLFWYGIIIILGIFISIHFIFIPNILIGLIFCCIIIYYLNTYKKYNILTREKLDDEKFNLLYSQNRILQKYPEIVDFLYYIENFKENNIQQYNELVSSFENFIKIYEYCIIDNNLIFKFYSTLLGQKIYILSVINTFIFTQQEGGYEKILIKQKIQAEKLLDKYLNNLVILKKKKIYYDGYNNNSNIIGNYNVLPYNLNYSSDYSNKLVPYNISNLIV